MQLLAGNALAAGGDVAAAQQRWQAAADADPTSINAHRAMVQLVETGAPVDEFQRGVVNYHNGVYELAIAAFDRLRAEDPSGRQGAASYFTGLSQLELGQTDSRAGRTRQLRRGVPRQPLLGRCHDDAGADAGAGR